MTLTDLSPPPVAGSSLLSLSPSSSSSSGNRFGLKVVSVDLGNEIQAIFFKEEKEGRRKELKEGKEER